jgi:hypothetical protein
MQPGFFDQEDRLAKLEKLGDPLPRLDSILDWRAFRPLLKVIHQKQRKSNAGRKPRDVCGGAVRIIACIEDPVVIETTAGMQEVEQRREQLPKILAHLDAKASEPEAPQRPPCRAPPQRGLFEETG